MTQHTIVSNDAWVAARRDLLDQEKAFMRQRDDLAAARRALPWVKVDKDYVFHGTSGDVSLADLFDGRSQLIVYHFMFGPEWEQGCPSCSYLADHFDGLTTHLAQRDVTLVAAARTPLERLSAYKQRMGWHFPFVSSLDNDFNFDFHVSFTPEELAGGEVYYNYHQTQFPMDEAPGISVFFKDDDGAIYHTYSSYARGLDNLIGAYQFLDLAPKGRDEDKLDFPMAWVRRHDEYES